MGNPFLEKLQAMLVLLLLELAEGREGDIRKALRSFTGCNDESQSCITKRGKYGQINSFRKNHGSDG